MYIKKSLKFSATPLLSEITFSISKEFWLHVIFSHFHKHSFVFKFTLFDKRGYTPLQKGLLSVTSRILRLQRNKFFLSKSDECNN